MNAPQHNVSLRVGGTVVERWVSYSVDSDMLTPADAFSLSMPLRRELYDLCVPDADVQVLLDDVVVMTGFIDERKPTGSRNATQLEVSGRDRAGRMVDESMPLGGLRGLGIADLAQKAAGPWFGEVRLDNATNRRLIRGPRAKLAKVTREPPIDRSPRAQKRVEPGEARADALTYFCKKAELLWWSTADGKALVVGLPCYDQEPQYRFVVPEEGSKISDQANVLSWDLTDSCAERYSAITVCGASRGTGADYGAAVTKRRATVTSKDFKHPKRLLLSDGDVRSTKEAHVQAAREMAERDGTKRTLELTVRGHDQEHDRGAPALYAFDTMADVTIEPVGLKGLFLVTGVKFSRSREAGETTTLRLVPQGTTLRL